MAAAQKVIKALPSEDSAEVVALVEAHVDEIKAEVEKADRLSIEVEVEVDGEIQTKTMNFRPLNVVPLGILRTTRHNSQEQMWRIFEWALAPADLDILDQVSSDKLDTVLVAMQKESGTELGES